MLSQICAYLRNYFCEDKDKHFKVFTISSGSIEPLDFLKDGQYFRIIGSTFNDGIYQYPCYELTDEEFDGAVWALKIPPRFLELVEEIKKFDAENEINGFQSESFGGYSYSKATVNGKPMTWKTAFANQLNHWRKI